MGITTISTFIERYIVNIVNIVFLPSSEDCAAENLITYRQSFLPIQGEFVQALFSKYILAMVMSRGPS
jgi:hypothetical protein